MRSDARITHNFHLHHLFTDRSGYYVDIQLQQPGVRGNKLVLLGHLASPDNYRHWHTDAIRLMKPNQTYSGKGSEIAVPEVYQKRFGMLVEDMGATLQAGYFITVPDTIYDYMEMFSPRMMKLVFEDKCARLDTFDIDRVTAHAA